LDKRGEQAGLAQLGTGEKKKEEGGETIAGGSEQNGKEKKTPP